MSETRYLIDQYQEAAAAEVLQRAQWAADAHDHYGFTSETAVIMGTRAMDMHGIDMRLPDSRQHNVPLDLDVVVPRSEMSRLHNDYPVIYNEDEIDGIFAEANIHLYQNFKGPYKLDATSQIYGGKEGRNRLDFEIANARSQVVQVVGRTGLYRTMDPSVAAAWKLSAREAKDKLAVTYGHVSAHRQGLEIVSTPEWKKVARQAIDEAEGLADAYKPDWLQDSENLRSHPAFAAL